MRSLIVCMCVPQDAETGPDAQSDCVYVCLREARRCRELGQMRNLTVCMCVPQGGKKMPKSEPDAQSDCVYVCASGRQKDADNWARCTV